MAKKKNPHILPSGLYADLGTPEMQVRVTFEPIKTDLGYANRIKDQRPIDKYHRWHCEDEAKDIAPDRCRGLNHDQYRIADRLYTLFMRTHRSAGQQWEPRVDQSASSDEAIHRGLQAVHDYRALMDRVNAESQRILEHFSLKLPLRSLAPLRIVKASVIALKKRATGTFFRRQFCCVCHSVVAYEEQRGWRKGYAIIRLREALDEMNEGRRK